MGRGVGGVGELAFVVYSDVLVVPGAFLAAAHVSFVVIWCVPFAPAGGEGA